MSKRYDLQIDSRHSWLEHWWKLAQVHPLAVIDWTIGRHNRSDLAGLARCLHSHNITWCHVSRSINCAIHRQFVRLSFTTLLCLVKQYIHEETSGCIYDVMCYVVLLLLSTAMRIHISQSTRDALLATGDKFIIRERGMVELKVRQWLINLHYIYCGTSLIRRR